MQQQMNQKTSEIKFAEIGSNTLGILEFPATLFDQGIANLSIVTNALDRAGLGAHKRLMLPVREELMEGPI